MSDLLFTNTAVTHATIARIQTILAHPENLPLWDGEITTVTATPLGFEISRQAPALNTTEELIVSMTANHISYHSHGGRLAYQLDFSFTATDALTTITETLRTSGDDLPVPIKLLMPIAKQAFAQKLQSLVALAESDQEVTV